MRQYSFIVVFRDSDFKSQYKPNICIVSFPSKSMADVFTIKLLMWT